MNRKGKVKKIITLLILLIFTVAQGSANMPVIDISNLMNSVSQLYAIYDQINATIEQVQNTYQQLETQINSIKNMDWNDLKGSFANNAEWIIFCQKGRQVFQQTQLLENRYKEGTQFHKGREPSKRYKTRFPACWFGAEYPKATYHAIWQKQNGIYHPTVKSVEFLSWLIQISSTPKELVFDGFMGTGSTALAALKNSRDYLGAEIDREYFAVAQKRIKEVFEHV